MLSLMLEQKGILSSNDFHKIVNKMLLDEASTKMAYQALSNAFKFD